MMKCSIEGCPGEYEERKVVHTVRHRGRVVVIDHVPAEVCSICGDVLLKPETVRRIEALLRSAGQPARTAPLYEYA
jgi:YgiT-type zinc finger domain-containing protein